jgi:DeoR/GlpR family transcriptional regulator of sugar metabolism
MILSELREYVHEHHVVNMYDLVTYFDTDADTIRDMLNVLIRKGQVRKVQDSDVLCRKCVHCRLLAAELYEWVD